jgi:spermidine/putrescine transport system permease protein
VPPFAQTNTKGAEMQKVAVITAGGSGMGAAAARRLAADGFAVAILSSAFQSLDKSLEEAAYDLGETPLSTFRLIILPLVVPGIISSFLICFTISIDEFIIANFLGSGEAVLSVYIFGQFRFPAKVPSMLALGTILVLVSILLLTIAEYFRRRGIAKTGGKDTGGFL